MYERLTKYAGTLAARDLETELGGGTIGVDDFIEDFYAVDGFADTDYFDTLKRYGVDTESGVDSCDMEHADLELVRACIAWCVRGDHFCDGCLAAHAKSGFLDRCLKRLKELDQG